MMKLCQMETTNFLLTKSLEFSIKMQMDILTLRWQVKCLTKQNKFMCTYLILIFDSSGLSIYVIIQEFLIAIDMALNGSPEEKLRWGFRIFDKDGSGEEWEPGEIPGSRHLTAQLTSPRFRINRTQRNDQNNDLFIGAGRNWKGRRLSSIEKSTYTTIFRVQQKRKPLIYSTILMWMVTAGWSWQSSCMEASRTRSLSPCSRRRRWRRCQRRSRLMCVLCWWRMRQRTRNSSQICHRDMRDILQDLFTSQCFWQWLTFSLAGDWLRGPRALITNYQSYLHFIISEPHTPDCPSDRLSVIECDNPNSQSTNITEWQLTHGAT